jgi:hypothetical protein
VFKRIPGRKHYPPNTYTHTRVRARACTLVSKAMERAGNETLQSRTLEGKTGRLAGALSRSQTLPFTLQAAEHLSEFNSPDPVLGSHTWRGPDTGTPEKIAWAKSEQLQAARGAQSQASTSYRKSSRMCQIPTAIYNITDLYPDIQRTDAFQGPTVYGSGPQENTNLLTGGTPLTNSICAFQPTTVHTGLGVGGN